MSGRPPAAPDAPPELALLLCCARRSLDGAPRERLRALLAAPVDFPALLALAARHRLLPLLHRHLHGELAPVPAEFAAELRARAAAAAHAGLRMAGELHRLLRALEGGGIAALAYKGPALAVEAYGDVGLRTMSDLDLLVAPADVPAALRVLAGLGYDPAHPLTPARERSFRRTDGDYPLVHRERAALVEVHAHVSSRRFGVALRTEELMARSRPLRVGGAEVRVPAADDLLLALALHGAKHRWARLEWLAAFAETARAHPDGVAAAVRRAPALGAARVLALALRLAGGLLELPLAGEAARLADGDAVAARLAADAAGRMAPAAAEEDGDAVASLLFNLRLRTGVRGRALYAWRWALDSTPEDWAALPLPDALFPLYRAARPVRLLARYAPRLLRRPREEA